MYKHQKPITPRERQQEVIEVLIRELVEIERRFAPRSEIDNQKTKIERAWQTLRATKDN